MPEQQVLRCALCEIVVERDGTVLIEHWWRVVPLSRGESEPVCYRCVRDAVRVAEKS